jgi:hypothetical protein
LVVQLVQQELQVLREHRELQDFKVLKVQLVRQAHKEPQAQPVQQELLELQAHRD